MQLRTTKDLSGRILPGKLAPDLDELYQEYVTELQQGDDYFKIPSLIELIKMFKFCPYNRIAVELKSLRAVASFGEYSHPDKRTVITSSGRQTLTEWVRGNFQTMQGNLPDVINKLFKQAYGFGYSVAEIEYSANVTGHQGEWRLWRINVLNPCRYRFAGRRGVWDRIIYRSRFQSHYPIPRKKLIHIYCPSMEEPENPYGDGQGIRGYNYFLARKLALKNWNGQLAKGVKGQTFVKADSNATVPKTNLAGEIERDDNGQPIPISAVQASADAVRRAGDGDVIGLDKSTEIQHFAGISGTGQDYNLALIRYVDDIFMSYGVPKTILGEGAATLGQAGLNAGHQIVLDTQIGSMVGITREHIVEQVAKDLLTANFGVTQQDDFGKFEQNKQLPPGEASMRITNIMSSMLQGIIKSNDLEAVNRVRVDCGLSALSAEEFQQQIVQDILQQQQSYAA